MFKKSVFATSMITLLSQNIMAEGFSSTSLIYMYGNSFEEVADVDTIPDGDLHTITLEHFSTWKYGANFFFVDMTKANYGNNGFAGKRDSNKVYAEWAPRLSLSAMTGNNLSFSFINDVHLAGQLNRGEDFNAELAGVGAMLDVPSFNFVEFNVYARDDNFNDKTSQLTVAWNATYNIGFPLVFEGFVDYFGVDDGSTVIFQPRLLLDSKYFRKELDGLQVGIEYYYYNTSAVPNFKSKVVESTPQFMAKWTW